jgi:hypothetical protein
VDQLLPDQPEAVDHVLEVLAGLVVVECGAVSGVSAGFFDRSLTQPRLSGRERSIQRNAPVSKKVGGAEAFPPQGHRHLLRPSPGT